MKISNVYRLFLHVESANIALENNILHLYMIFQYFITKKIKWIATRALPLKKMETNTNVRILV